MFAAGSGADRTNTITLGVMERYCEPVSVGSFGLIGPLDIFGLPALTQRADEQDTTLTLTDPSTPERLYLGQNQPNPFRAGTSITYGLPSPSWVNITVHTMLGTQLRTIVSEPQKSGNYTVQFSDIDLQPGIYFYRIETDYGVLTRRMTVSR